MILKKSPSWKKGFISLVKYNFQCDQFYELLLDFSYLNDALKLKIKNGHFKLIFIQDNVVCLSFQSYRKWYRITDIRSMWKTVESSNSIARKISFVWEMVERKSHLVSVEKYLSRPQ